MVGVLLWAINKYLPMQPTIQKILNVVVIVVMLVAKLTEKMVDGVGMGFFNHIGGAALGIVKGVILVSILLFIFKSFDPKEKWLTVKDKQGSFFYSHVAEVFPKLMKTFGGEIKFPNWSVQHNLKDTDEERLLF